MRKTLALTLFAAGALAAGSCSTLCFAEEAASTPSLTSPAAAPSQHEMHQMRQLDSNEQNQNKSEDDPGQADSSVKEQTDEQPQEPAGAAVQVPVEDVPSPSQRDMRQHIREAKRNTAPAAANQ